MKDKSHRRFDDKCFELMEKAHPGSSAMFDVNGVSEWVSKFKPNKLMFWARHYEDGLMTIMCCYDGDNPTGIRFWDWHPDLQRWKPYMR